MRGAQVWLDWICLVGLRIVTGTIEEWLKCADYLRLLSMRGMCMLGRWADGEAYYTRFVMLRERLCLGEGF